MCSCQYVAVCFSVLQCVAVCCSVLQSIMYTHTRPVYSCHEGLAGETSLLQYVLVCCSVLQFVAVHCSLYHIHTHDLFVLLKKGLQGRLPFI